MLTLVNGTVIDGIQQQPRRRAALRIAHGEVAGVYDSSEQVKEFKGEIRDCSGMTILPGLSNVHVHLALNGDTESYETKLPRLKGLEDEELVPIYLDQARANLEAGITTIRDLHPGPGGTTRGMLVARSVIEHGHAIGSRIHLALRPLVMSGGHGTQWLSKSVSGQDEIRRAVRENIAEGSDVIKIMAAHSWGQLPGRPESWRRYLTMEELQAAVEVAHRSMIPVSVHAHGTEAIAESVLAGVDSIEYGSGINGHVAELMAERGCFLVPTLSSFQNFLDVGEEYGVSELRRQEAMYVVQRQRTGFKAALQAGVKVVAGNDAGFQYLPHGSSLVRELELYVELGMKPIEAIQAATSVAAQLLQCSDQQGSLSPGMRADVLVVEGDASTDISTLKNVRLVIKDGVIVRDDLQDAERRQTAANFGEIPQK